MERANEIFPISQATCRLYHRLRVAANIVVRQQILSDRVVCAKTMETGLFKRSNLHALKSRELNALHVAQLCNSYTQK